MEATSFSRFNLMEVRKLKKKYSVELLKRTSTLPSLKLKEFSPVRSYPHYPLALAENKRMKSLRKLIKGIYLYV